MEKIVSLCFFFVTCVKLVLRFVYLDYLNKFLIINSILSKLDRIEKICLFFKFY